MSNIIRNETAHEINGVHGRLFTLHRPPAPWKVGTFANQTWISESRKVGEEWGVNASMKVNIRFDDTCKNGHNNFAITADIRSRRGDEAGGCMHDEIVKYFPELAYLIRWHLCSTDGPMHYVANTLYHTKANGPQYAWVYFTGAIDPLGIADTKERSLGYLKEVDARKAEGAPGYRLQWDEKTVKMRNLEDARSAACWPEATDAQLCAPAEELKAALLARLPALLKTMRADIEGAGFMWECPAA